MASITTRVTSGTGATVKNSPLSNSEIDNNFININYQLTNNLSLSKSFTGFIDANNSAISFNTTNRTLTLTPIGTLNVYLKGVEYNIPSAKTLQIANTDGGRYIIYDPVTAQLLDVGSTSKTIFQDNILVAYVYWQVSGSIAVIFADERHTVARDTTWHVSNHFDVGAVWRSGGSVSCTINNSNLVNVGLTTPIVVADEDLEFTFVNASNPVNPYEQVLNGTAYLPILYLSGTTYRQITATNIPWNPGTTRATYNPISAGSGSLADVTNDNYYVNYWMIATNDRTFPIKMVMGRVSHATEQAADSETIESYGLPMPEIVPLYKFTLKTASTLTQNLARVQIVSYKEIITAQNQRRNFFENIPHNVISNRFAADQHNIAAITGLQSALDLKLNSADITYTAADVLNKIKTVDGAGSGLDADLLDGKSSTDFWENNSTWVGTNFPGTLYKGAASNGGAVAAIQDSPVSGKLSWLIDGSYYTAESGGYYSMSGQDYTTRKGWYTDGTSSIWNSHVIPTANNTYNLGSSSMGWANVYTNDLHLSNMNKEGGNDIDHTNGNWTIQEGEEVLYIINNRNGKKYKFKLEEV